MYHCIYPVLRHYSKSSESIARLCAAVKLAYGWFLLSCEMCVVCNHCIAVAPCCGLWDVPFLAERSVGDVLFNIIGCASWRMADHADERFGVLYATLEFSGAGRW
jgi:hypothetical protein